MDDAGSAKTPFLFGLNFEMTEGFFVPYPLSQNKILFDINGISNSSNNIHDTSLHEPDVSQHELIASGDFHFDTYPECYSVYKHRFNIVMEGLKRGDSYLTNLTIRTKVNSNLSLKDIFYRSNSPYKICIPQKWVCFSPECFIQIDKGTIRTYPMKGTIDATIPDAENKIINDKKEVAEHNTVVDLMRNDISLVATDVKLNRFRYTNKILTNKGTILQISSEIEGIMTDGWEQHIGTILCDLLPAGSISGAPKKTTLTTIQKAEQYPRGYYTGVAGYFDGIRLETFVLIRFIEQSEGDLFFRSGGGITVHSMCQKEYLEAIQKVYLPFFGK